MEMKEWIEMFEAIEEGKEVMVPYQLHSGIRIMTDAFGSIQEVRAYFEKVRDAEAPVMKENE